MIIAAVLLVPLIGSATAVPLIVPPAAEQLVEGHTVWVVVQNDAPNFTRGDLAAAVAVLIREVTFESQYLRFPGVLWFNDQYLVEPTSAGETRSAKYRYPCTGAVLAVNQGDGDPRLDAEAGLLNPSTYVESYHLTDPNNRQWDVDKWNVSGKLVWTSPIFNAGVRSNVSDDGSCNRNPPRASGSAAARPDGYKYPCGGNGDPSCPAIEYNGLLFFYIEDLTVPGAPKNHSVGSTDSKNDVSACHEPNVGPQRNWPCPGDNDHREGNSHPYNPRPLDPDNIGRTLHGWSDDCTGDGDEDRNCHATRQVDIYYGRAPWVQNRQWRFIDAMGSAAPYHCHKDPDVVDYCT